MVAEVMSTLDENLKKEIQENLESEYDVTLLIILELRQEWVVK